MLTKNDLMNLDSLMMLLAVEESNGKRRAASTINTSIDTITKYIEYLEEELGTKLLASNGRGSILTPAAKNVIIYAHEISNILNQLRNIKDESVKASGEVRVGLDLGVAAVLPMYGINGFFDEYPNIKVIATSTMDGPNLNTMEFDVALSCELPQGADVVLLASKKFECAFFASPQYLREHGCPKDLDDLLQNHRMVGNNGNYVYEKDWKTLFKKSSHLNFISNDRMVLIEAIKNHLGVGLLPMRFKDEGLVPLENIKSEAGITFNLSANRKSKDTPRVKAFIVYCKNLLESF